MNKKIVFITLAILVTGVLACSTQNASDGGEDSAAKAPGDLKVNYSHEVHKKVMDKEGFDCFVCHPMNVEVEEELSVEELIKISNTSFFPGKETCHFCHFNPEAGNIAPNQCDMCHANLAEIQPKNHNFNWSSKHAVFSKADQESCESCHAPVFCQDCHKRRDLPTQRVHDRNFRFIHGIEARADPRQCGNCHQITFCDTCHIKGGYDY